MYKALNKPQYTPKDLTAKPPKKKRALNFVR